MYMLSTSDFTWHVNMKTRRYVTYHCNPEACGPSFNYMHACLRSCLMNSCTRIIKYVPGMERSMAAIFQELIIRVEGNTKK